MTDAQNLAALVLLLASIGAGLLLRRAWSQRNAQRVWFILGGWTVIAVATLAAAMQLGEARGVFIAAMLASVGVLGVAAASVQVRPARAASDKASLAPEPSDRPSRAWRGVLRFLLAGPIGGIAAMGVAVAWTVWLPFDDKTRIVTGGLVAPVLWGALMAWTLSDDKIIRATAVLLGVAIATFGIAALKGIG
ncbi:MAG: hypothetical protein QM773_00635 [Hyphomonadaceae bacterium]